MYLIKVVDHKIAKLSKLCTYLKLTKKNFIILEYISITMVQPFNISSILTQLL